MGKYFNALNGAEQATVAAFVRAEYDRLATLDPPTYLLRNAQADPAGWQDRLRELIAMDPTRVRAIMEKSQRDQSHGSQGFTLIELSIVLVIIGLIVGGVLVGRDLINAAGARAQISQIEKYNTAVNTFRGKYGYLPGDIKDPDASSFGFSARGRYAGEGDGNGVLEGVIFDHAGVNAPEFQAAGEVVMFWVDLSQSKLIDATFSAANSTTPPGSDLTPTSTPGLQAFFPQAKLGQGNYVYVHSNATYSSGSWHTGGTNYFGVSAITLVAASSNSSRLSSNPGMTVQQAFAIDTKIDDGLPQSGNVTAQYLNNDVMYMDGWDTVSQVGPDMQGDGGTATSCFDNAWGGSTIYKYSISQNGGAGVNCALSFRFQ